ncbi:MAG: hypothetical protein EBU93_06970, partial [Chlamydiae bacterium]|nr:hypothetical protein [Chlamydiota bacterium]
ISPPKKFIMTVHALIESINKLTGETFILGEIFFLKLSDWGTKIKGRLLDFYNQRVYDICENASRRESEFFRHLELNLYI